MGKAICNSPLLPESKLSISGKEVEVDSLLSKKDYLISRPSLNTTAPKAASQATINVPLPKLRLIRGSTAREAQEEVKKVLNPATLKSAATQSKFKNPVLETTVLEKSVASKPNPRHDPSAPGSLVLKQLKNVPKGRQLVDVVVDPLLSKHLRDHQREGVKFLYECVMDIRDFGGQGAVLADEMGLGKTLQTITLLWTLLKQNPVYEDPPVIKKALIVCPATLINNWRKEFRKWLGAERIGVFVVDDNKKRIADFTLGRTYSIIVISYEKLRANIDGLQKGHGIDIVIADEGHRLKKEQNKSGVAIRSLNTPRRIILSGTPIQNDLSEFFSMVNFVNPGILGSVKSFAKQFEIPIVKSRQPDASEKDIENGQICSEELAERTSSFILRRTVDILSKHLPPKTEYILLCRPTAAQATVYQRILTSSFFQAALGGSSELHLQLITLLKKVCNSPRLLRSPSLSSSSTTKTTFKDLLDPDAAPSFTDSLLSELPSHLLHNNGASAKIRVLDSLLTTLHSISPSEKIVLVSHHTSTLTLLSSLLDTLFFPYLRLDGSTPASKRQDLVDTFNRASSTEVFAFLLSAKAGGQGLNLIGASRLVLFDVDWNPAIDMQAMARIHRDGQRRPCVVYRFLLAGALDEKIWQRQVTKGELAESVMDGKKGKGGKAAFSREELKDLFRLDTREDGGCQTHELIGCSCGGKGIPSDAVHVENRTEVDGETEGEEEEADNLPLLPTLLKANKVDMEAQERRIQEKKATKRRDGKKEKEKMQSLMGYAHIDTHVLRQQKEADGAEEAVEEEDKQVGMQALIRDEVLLRVLKGQEEEGEQGRVSYVWAKTSGGNNLSERTAG